MKRRPWKNRQTNICLNYLFRDYMMSLKLFNFNNDNYNLIFIKLYYLRLLLHIFPLITCNLMIWKRDETMKCRLQFLCSHYLGSFSFCLICRVKRTSFLLFEFCHQRIGFMCHLEVITSSFKDREVPFTLKKVMMQFCWRSHHSI